MKAPEKIFVPNNPAVIIAAYSNKTAVDDVEYTRTDAFIEKAVEFLDGCIPDYINLKHANVDTFMNVDNKRFVEDFKNYMEGE